MNDAIAKRLLPCPAFKDRFIVIATIGSMQMPWARLQISFHVSSPQILRNILGMLSVLQNFARKWSKTCQNP